MMRDCSTARVARREKAPDSPAILRGGITYLLLVVLRSRSLRRTTISLVVTIARRFFIDQFGFKLRPGAVPVRNIEHPLDAGIPVRYETVDVYLTFIKLWISSLSYLRRRLGESFDDDIVDFMRGLERCYSDASSVYGRCLSTTRRPGRAPGLRLAFVYAVDPHLFCVPSLHVLVVCYTYRRIDDLLRARGASGEYSDELIAIRSRAVAITESILYVRQHSVNCIPAALAMLSVIVPSYDEAESRSFLSGLFSGDEAITPERHQETIAYMGSLYDDLMAAGPGRDERYGAIVDFLMNYEEMDLDGAVGGAKLS